MGQWGQGVEPAVQGARSQKDDTVAVHETVSQRHTHKVGDKAESQSSETKWHTDDTRSSMPNPKMTHLSTEILKNITIEPLYFLN